MKDEELERRIFSIIDDHDESVVNAKGLSDRNIAAIVARQRVFALISQALTAEREKADARVVEARYMGTADFMQWILRHDESSFRQERAWFKVKPGLLLGYQAELMKNLDRIHTNTGLDPDATVPQVKHDPGLAQLRQVSSSGEEGK